MVGAACALARLLTARSHMQVNLKRKHWGASGAESHAGQRCRDVFQRQLALAAAAGAPAGQDRSRLKGAQQGAAKQGARHALAKGRSHPAIEAVGEGHPAGGPGAGAARGRQGRGFKVRLLYFYGSVTSQVAQV